MKPKSKEQQVYEKQLKKRSKIQEYAHTLEDTMKVQSSKEEEAEEGEEAEEEEFSYDPLQRFKKSRKR